MTQAGRRRARGEDPTPRANLYDEVTARIVAELEAGRFPWVQPWGRASGGGAISGLPRNALTARNYSGVNVLILWGAVIEHGYPSQSWLTFRQAREAGGAVRKGEKGVTVVYADRFTPEAEKERARASGEDARTIPFLKRFTVFNVAQCEGLRAGLATQMGATHWRLAPELGDTLRRMGERGDIVRTMQRAYAARGDAPAIADQAIYDPSAPDARTLVGRVVERGLSDEINDRHYLIVEATDGRSHYVEIGRSENLGATSTGAIVRIAPAEHGVRQADRTIAEVAAANDGRYTIDAHLQHDPSATEAYAETHVLRLEAMRRLMRNVEREPDGTWIIAPDHLTRATAYEAARAKDRPVAIDTLSSQPLEKLVDADAATWLDKELVAGSLEPLRDAGFGHDARIAQDRRRQWLIAEQMAEEQGGRTIYRPHLIATLQRRELLRVAGQLSGELGLEFSETRSGDRIEGRLSRMVEMTGGRYALVQKSREFTLVSWRPVLERQIGKPVAGIMRGDGISWAFGRGRKGPQIS